MIPLHQAISIVLDSVIHKTHTQKVDFIQSLGRVLAANISSDLNMPPFNKTAVDGYACRMADAYQELEVVEVIPAGKAPTKVIHHGQCAKIMTGAMIPQGADCVLMVEDTKQISENRIAFTGKSVKSNICLLGEDIKKNDIALTKGTTIEPHHIAIMAAVGCTQPEVSAKPRVAILSTGDELVEPSIAPAMGQIRNSNGHQLIAQVIKAGGEPHYFGIIEDSEDATRAAIAKAIAENDMVLLTGGVSMGDFDFVPKIMAELGVKIHFDSIAVQPGKPTTFGTVNGKLIFGLPGNPVSSLFQFDLLVKPAIRKALGAAETTPSTVKLPLGSSYKRKKTERLALIPVEINDKGEVNPVNFNGSAHIFAIANANAVALIPQGVAELQKGDFVDVRPL